MTANANAGDVASTKPYLVRAIYEWCSDQGFTPYLAVSVNDETRVGSTAISTQLPATTMR